MFPTRLILSLFFLLFAVCPLHAAPMTSSSSTTCPCRARTTAPVNVCALSAGDPSWCTFHMCAPGFECIDAAWATHTCRVSQSTGVYKCLVNERGMIIKPRPHETTRCKCVHHDKQLVHHITPIS